MTGKTLAALWDEVQGACDLARMQQALGAASSLEVAGAALDGWSPLHFLCENRSLANAVRAQGIALLVQAGVDCNALDENGWSALHLLCKNRSRADEWGSDLSASLHELIAAAALVNSKTADSNKMALHLLCENDACSAAAVEVLLKACADANAVDADGSTPLHYASENAEATAAIFELLLTANANPNVQNHFQATPFHYLCQSSAVTPDAIRVMLQHGADPNIANNIGNSPLHYLCENYAVSVSMLSEVVNSKRANLTTTNSLGKTAFDCLPSAKHECIAYLQKFAAPTLVASKATHAAEVGGEDPSELPAPLQQALAAWNASLPPCDLAFYHAVCCEPAFASAYEDVQEISVKLSESPSDAPLFSAWEASLKTWRASVVLAFAALIPPQTWEQYATKYARPVPADLLALASSVRDVWGRFPDQSQRRDRFESLAAIVKTA